MANLLTRLQTDYDEELTRTINELLGSTFIEHLRDRLAEAERLRKEINSKLAQHPTGTSGLRLRLERVAVAEESTAKPGAAHPRPELRPARTVGAGADPGLPGPPG